MKHLRKINLAIVLVFSTSACVSVQEYQKVYLNDPNMILADCKLMVYETNFQSYREGAVGANGGKTGGGCGCN